FFFPQASPASHPTRFSPSRPALIYASSTTRPLATTLGPPSHPHHSLTAPVYPAVHRPTLLRSRLHWMIARSTTRRRGTPLGPSSHPHRSLPARVYPAALHPSSPRLPHRPTNVE